MYTKTPRDSDGQFRSYEDLFKTNTNENLAKGAGGVALVALVCLGMKEYVVPKIEEHVVPKVKEWWGKLF